MIRIGEHRVTCGSITSPAVDEMLCGETVDVLYCDPPWDNMAYWKTLAQRMTGKAPAQITHEQLYDRIVELIRRYVRGYVFIETGLLQEIYVRGRLISAGLNVISYPATYAKTKPHVLLVGAVKGRLPRLRFDPRSEPELERCAIASVRVPGGIVLDPCCGMGYTAIATLANGMRFRGNEFNSKRLEKTVAILHRGQKYERAADR